MFFYTNQSSLGYIISESRIKNLTSESEPISPCLHHWFSMYIWKHGIGVLRDLYWPHARSFASTLSFYQIFWYKNELERREYLMTYTCTYIVYTAQKIKNNLLALICDRCHSGFSGEFKILPKQTSDKRITFIICIAYNYDVGFKSIVTETNEFLGSSRHQRSRFSGTKLCESEWRIVNPHKNGKLIIITLINQIFPFALKIQ